VLELRFAIFANGRRGFFFFFKGGKKNSKVTKKEIFAMNFM
jgi:hypothetical protein